MVYIPILVGFVVPVFDGSNGIDDIEEGFLVVHFDFPHFIDAIVTIVRGGFYKDPFWSEPNISRPVELSLEKFG